ncbi:hypothetical protein AB6E53_11785 [Vibrio breoganii]
MKNTYEPESWSVLQVESKDQQTEYLIFGIWFGTFDTPDRWRLSSGCSSLVGKLESNGTYQLPQTSGSIYRLNPNGYGQHTAYTRSILNSLVHKLSESKSCIQVTILDLHKDNGQVTFPMTKGT